MQRLLKVGVDGLWGPESQAAAFKRWGVTSADDAMREYLLETQGSTISGRVTPGISAFYAYVSPEEAFVERGGAYCGGKKYTDYKEYIEAALSMFTNAGVPGSNASLSDNEVITIMKRYGLA